MNVLDNGARRNEVIVLGVIFASYLFVWPVGEYAIMDDWSFLRSLERLHFEGELKIFDYNPMSLIGLLLWTLPFTKIFGFSFTVAKLSVVVLHSIECLTVLRILQLCGVGSNLALAGILALILNPLHFVHVFMYMTDIPAITWQMVSVLCYLNGITRPNRDSHLSGLNCGWLIAGSVASSEAFLIRQSGIFVPLAFSIYLVRFERSRLSPLALFAAFGPVLFVVIGFSYWYGIIHGATSTNIASMKLVQGFVCSPPFSGFPYIYLTFLAYLGWFVLPLAVAVPLSTYQFSSRIRLAGFIGIAWVTTNLFFYFAASKSQVFPYISNVITPFGVYFPDEWIVGNREMLWNQSAGWGLGCFSVLAGLAFIQRVLAVSSEPQDFKANIHETNSRHAEHSGQPVLKSYRVDTPFVSARFLMILLAVDLFYVLLTTRILFDRHLLLIAPVVVCLFCALCRTCGRMSMSRFGVAILLMAFYGIAVTHDLHALSRVAFLAGQKLIADGVSPDDICGGYAFDGWQAYGRHRSPPSPRIAFQEWWKPTVWDEIRLREAKNCLETESRLPGWWVGTISRGPNEKYIISCSAPGSTETIGKQYDIDNELTYRRWWPWRLESVYLLKRRQADNESHSIGVPK